MREKIMPKKLFSGTMLILLIFIYSQAAFNRNTFFVSASEPSKLKIYVGPPSVLADNKSYESIFIQLQDSTGAPARARQDTIIHLSSSLTQIGTVDLVITIAAESTYAAANFTSTYTPGTTTITAAASGYTTVQASITTVGPVPSKLAVYSFPPTVPADGGSYPAIVVQLQDPSGSPAKAPIGDVNVTLSSANVTVGTVDPFVIIKAGSTYATATFYTTITPGSADITALASGYDSGFATINTQAVLPATLPTCLKVYVGPPSVPADGIAYKQVAVQLQNSSGYIGQAPDDIAVALSSSDTAVGTVEATITIRNSKVYALANFSSTYKSGTTTITAAATNCKSGQASLATVGPIPLKLAVYCVPPSLPADNRSYDAVLVQLQDSRGIPARDPSGNITVYLSSSILEAGNVSSTLIIPFGKTQSTANFFSTYTASPTTITALTSDYETGQATVTTYLIDQYNLNVSVTAQPTTVNSNEQAAIKVYVAYNGLSPAAGATIQLTSNNGGSFSATTDEGNGYYDSNFTAPFVTTQTVCTILASASRSGYTSGQANVQVTVTSLNLNVSVTAQPATIDSGQQANVTVYLTSGVGPTAGATVQLTSDNGGNFSAITDEGNGYYDSVFTAPAVTTQTVCTILATASRPGYTSEQASVQVTVTPIILNVSVTAQPDSINSIQNATITVYVAYNGINPASGATINLTSNNGGSFSATTDEGNGSYTSVFTAPTVTTQTVCTILAKASKVGYVTGQASIQVTVNFTIHTGSILLHIKDDSGNAVTEANVTSTTQPTGISQLNGITDDAGILAFNNVLEGSYTFQITKSGYDTKNQTITVTADQTTDTTINLTKTPSPLLSTPVLIAIVAIVIIAIVIIVIVLRKYRISFSTGQDSNSEANH
jgi:adhesin/invasin